MICGRGSSTRIDGRLMSAEGTRHGHDGVRELAGGRVVAAEIGEDLVYGVTKALWHDNARILLDDGHAKGRVIRLETALDGVGIPLHPGAERYYREVGMLE